MASFTDDPVDIEKSLARELGGNQLPKKKKRAAHLSWQELMESLIGLLLIENSDLENFRQYALQTIVENKSFIIEKIEELINVPVAEIWVHGSLVDPNKFSESSDIDIIAIIDDDSKISGIDKELSELVAGRVCLGDIGCLDAIVLNKSRPSNGIKL